MSGSRRVGHLLRPRFVPETTGVRNASVATSFPLAPEKRPKPRTDERMASMSGDTSVRMEEGGRSKMHAGARATKRALLSRVYVGAAFVLRASPFRGEFFGANRHLRIQCVLETPFGIAATRSTRSS